MHLVGILFPHINDDARSKSHQICSFCRAIHHGLTFGTDELQLPASILPQIKYIAQDVGVEPRMAVLCWNSSRKECRTGVQHGRQHNSHPRQGYFRDDMGSETSRKYRCSRRQLCWPEVMFHWKRINHIGRGRGSRWGEK